MSKILYLLIILVSACSLNKNSKFWTNSKILDKETKINYEEIFPEEEALKKEFNSNLKIRLDKETVNNTSTNNYLNNDKRLNFDGELKKSSRYKFSKIKNFHSYQPELSFFEDNIIFFDNKGSILQFDKNSKLIWKKNY